MSDETANTDRHTANPSEDVFDVNVVSKDGVVVLAARGELDACTAPLLAKAIDHNLTEANRGLIVDLSDVEFLASAGMTVLLAGHHSAHRCDKGFRVVADGRRVSRPMKLMGLDQELSLHATICGALAEFP